MSDKRLSFLKALRGTKKFPILVFDYDQTLWDELQLFPGVLSLLDALYSCGFIMLMSSFNSNCQLSLFETEISKYFCNVTIRSPKSAAIKLMLDEIPDKECGFIFFDDQKRNIDDVSAHYPHSTCCLVDAKIGVTKVMILETLAEHLKKFPASHHLISLDTIFKALKVAPPTCLQVPDGHSFYDKFLKFTDST